MKQIPLVDLKAGFLPLKDEVLRAVEDVLDGMNLNLGPHCQALEREFASYCGTTYAVGVGSGTEAIQFALLACGVREGDEVITSAHTFFATAEAIMTIGATPVFVDIEPVSYTLNPDEVKKRITERTKAIVPVHMYGQCADMDPIRDIAVKNGLHLIEDSAQAHGALYRDKKAGTLGSAGCFSFYFTKNLGCYGEGGMVITNDEEIYEKVRLYRNHGHASKYNHVVVGYNGRLDEIQAAILRIKLVRLDEYNQRRREKAAFYQDLLKKIPVKLPEEAEHREHVYHLYVVRTQERDLLQEYLMKNGIGTGIHYKVPVHLQEAVTALGYKKGDLPKVEEACDEILSLPLYPELEEDSQVYIVEKIKEFYAR